MTNSDRLQEIRERAEKATEGPWACWDGWGPISGGYLKGLMAMARIGPSGGRSQEVLSASDETQRDIYAKRQDAEFIAASREDIPYLLQLVTEQQREIEDLKTKRQVEEARSAAAFKVSEAHPVEFSRALMEEMRQRGLIPKGSVEDILTSFVLDRPTAQFPSSKSGGDQ